MRRPSRRRMLDGRAELTGYGGLMVAADAEVGGELDSSHELLEAIRLEETSLLEFREVRFSGSRVVGPAPDELADELAAFANSRGGVLVLGVEDKSRDIVGILLDRLDEVAGYVNQ